MGLDEIRELEDLKAEYSDLAKKYNAMVDSEEKDLISKTVNEFANYFGEAKFNVQRSETSISAKYGGSSATLDFSNPKGYVGVKIKLKLTVSMPSEKSQFMVALNPKNPEPVVNFGTRHQKPIVEEIEDYKAKIEKMKLKIESGSIGPYFLYVKREKSSDSLKCYNSLTDLLNEITA
jgi:hypothetical protein